MRFDPSIFVTRVVVEAGGGIRTAYDEHFHRGLNIIRGENSSGKSTILNFILYGLGGDLADWSDAARRCSRVTIGAEVSGKPVTLSREISQTHGQPMEIFGGSFEASRNAPRSEWLRFPYRRSDSRESFSQAMFRLLDLPQVRSEASGSAVTMHQALRLLYADQLSPIDELFRAESFDSALTRDAVGRLLCGAYDARLYENELRFRELDRELAEVSGQLRSLFAVGGRVGESLTPEWIEAERARLAAEREQLQTELEAAELGLLSARQADPASRAEQEKAYSEVQNIQVEIAEARRRRDATALQIADSDAFIANLEGKLAALGDATLVSEAIGEATFKFCPSCHAPVSEEVPPGCCHLCRSPFDPERSRTRLAALINDIALQVRQSRFLQANRVEKLERQEAELRHLDARWRTASARLRDLARLPSTESQDRARALQRRAGYLDRQVEDLEQRARAAELVQSLSQRKSRLASEIGKLRAGINSARLSQQSRFEQAKTRIADEVLGLLREDLRREEAFENPRSVEFDFAANRITVNQQSYFSASSRAVLKTSFVTGFLFAAAKDAAFRHPRFCMVDTVEDKGMEPERSRNFQMVLAARSAALNSEHQIILATAMIAPELDDEQYTVGRFSTRDEPTLELS